MTMQQTEMLLSEISPQDLCDGIPICDGGVVAAGAFLSADEIRSLINSEPPLIVPADPEQLIYMEGSAYDLRLDKVFEIPQSQDNNWRAFIPFIGVNHRRTPPVIEVAPESRAITLNGDVEKGGTNKILVEFTGWLLEWNKSYLVQTVETVTLPASIFGLCDPRTTLARSDAHMFASPVSPGYSGVLTFGLKVEYSDGLYLEKGARIASIRFGRLGPGKTDPYKGQWGKVGGDKVGTEGKATKGW